MNATDTRLPRCNGEWMDESGSCKLCGRAIETGHAPSCRYGKLQDEADELREKLQTAEQQLGQVREALSGLMEVWNSRLIQGRLAMIAIRAGGVDGTDEERAWVKERVDKAREALSATPSDGKDTSCKFCGTFIGSGSSSPRIKICPKCFEDGRHCDGPDEATPSDGCGKGRTDKERLDWLLNLIRHHGTDGAAAIPWTLLEDDGEDSDLVLDRDAIDLGMSMYLDPETAELPPIEEAGAASSSGEEGEA